MINRSEQERARVRCAWKMFRYFQSNEGMLADADNLKLYEKAKDILIRHYNTDDDMQTTEEAIILLASVQNKCEPDDFELTEEIVSFISE